MRPFCVFSKGSLFAHCDDPLQDQERIFYIFLYVLPPLHSSSFLLYPSSPLLSPVLSPWLVLYLVFAPKHGELEIIYLFTVILDFFPGSFTHSYFIKV